jgi:hypothetical protein
MGHRRRSSFLFSRCCRLLVVIWRQRSFRGTWPHHGGWRQKRVTTTTATLYSDSILYILRRVCTIIYRRRCCVRPPDLGQEKKKITDYKYFPNRVPPTRDFNYYRMRWYYYSNSVHGIRAVGPLLQSREANACNHGIIARIIRYHNVVLLYTRAQSRTIIIICLPNRLTFGRADLMAGVRAYTSRCVRK